MCNETLDLLVTDKKNYEALVNFSNNIVVRKKRSGAASRTRYKLKELKAQNFKCLDCSSKFEKDADGNYPSATKEHVIPHRYGSSHAGFNIVWLCSKCNNKRNNPKKIKAIIEEHFGYIDWELLKEIE